MGAQVLLLPLREKVSPEATDEGCKRGLGQPGALALLRRVSPLLRPLRGHLLPQGEKATQVL
jgi:hypothetical protein